MKSSLPFAALLAMAAFLTPDSLQAVGGDMSRGQWQRHYSADAQLVNMAPTPSGVYALIHPMVFRSGSFDDIATPSPCPFFIDEVSHTLKPLASVVPLSGEAVRVMRYNPLGGYLLIGYDSGAVDLLHDDGSKRESTVLSMNSFPGKRKLHEATFSPDGARAYVATDFGYLKIGKLSADDKAVNLGGALSAIAEAGSDLIALLPDGSIVSAPASVSQISRFSPLMLDSGSDSRLRNADGSMRTTRNIMPLSSDAFAALVAPAEGLPILTLVVRRGDQWHAVVLSQDTFRLGTTATALNSIAEYNGIPNRDGYYLHANFLAYQLLRDVDFSLPDEKLKEAVMLIRYHTGDPQRESASWDFSDFTFYLDREGFYSRKVESGYGDATKWNSPGEKVVSTQPLAFISDAITYHPTRGLILQNHGVSYSFGNQLTQMPSALCGLKDGVWANYSPSWHIPAFIEGNTTLANLYNTRRMEYPVSYPKGVEVDPDNPEYVYSGSMQGGVVRFNLADPTAPILHMSHPSDRCSGFPGFVKNATTLKAWGALCNFTPPKFDGDGNLWSLYYDLDRQRGGDNSAVVRVWPKADRLASENANTDPSLFKEWKTLVYPDVTCTNYGFLLPLQNSVNSTLLILSGNSYAAPIQVINHKGTLEDTSDDTVTVLSDLTDAEGAWVQKDKIFAMKEDPTTGMVWVCTNSGVFYFAPSSAPYQPGLVMRPRPLDPARGTVSTLLDAVMVHDIAFDAEGRKWLATYGEGVVCLSADNSRIEGQWTTRNSPLPSDIVYAVGCDLSAGNVLVSTDRGLAEYVPEGAPRRVSGAGVSVTPTRVQPGYSGWITAKGLPSSPSFIIVGVDGEKIRELASPGDGTLRWDGRDLTGEKVSSGRYFITLPSSPEDKLAEVLILR